MLRKAGALADAKGEREEDARPKGTQSREGRMKRKEWYRRG